MAMIDQNFWKGRRVFVTGHTGFKGAWLSQWLVELGAVVGGYSLEPPTEPSLFRVLGLEDSIEHRTGDIRDPKRLEDELIAFSPEIVFHLAAQPLVRLSYKEPRLTYETNVMGTLNLLEAVRSCGNVRAVVAVTTDKCYENREWVWGYRETDPMGGYDPYSSSKGCAELLAAAYRRSYFNPEQYGKSHNVALATARAGNVIGGGDWALDRLVPDCVRSLAKGETITIRSPRATRPWQHVLDPLAGYLRLAERLYFDGPAFGEGWNFGPGDEGVRDVEGVVSGAIASWGGGEYRIALDADLHEAQLLKLDPSKAKARLGWSVQLSVMEAIDWSVRWYRAFTSGEDMRKLTVGQIAQYVEAIS